MIAVVKEFVTIAGLLLSEIVAITLNLPQQSVFPQTSNLLDLGCDSLWLKSNKK